MRERNGVVYWLGQVEYRPACALQAALVEARKQGRIGDTVLLLEHPHVYTLGRRGRMDDVLLDRDALTRAGVEVHEADRGGEVTYHGPGQLVGYPIMDIRPLGGPVRYVRALEAALMEALASYGVEGHRQQGMPGVWVGEPGNERKIAAIGLRVSRGVSSHGFALNVSTRLSYFEHIVACGVPDLRVTSLERELGGDVDPAAVREATAKALATHLRMDMHWRSAADIETILALEAAGASLL
ncbi:MAG: lipoyl(octanoyl) transferase LipB [Chloroflexi bacterium]|nr:lipoyl(octanoyl) transferase LipB [Chloroflexota bacterium]